MRNLSALLFVLLLCSLQLVSSAPAASNPVIICCPALTQMKLPLKHIVSYNWTRSDCSIKAVVFKMISGTEICVDPASDWVNDHMKAVDQRQLVSSGESPEFTQLHYCQCRREQHHQSRTVGLITEPTFTHREEGNYTTKPGKMG
uniref:Chemokine interleukin-8-like domain-containing protein n=1 Tax=Electrophorus electricus TaxID=8005 RepID=A0AAY5EL99_ELEEL